MTIYPELHRQPAGRPSQTEQRVMELENAIDEAIDRLQSGRAQWALLRGIAAAVRQNPSLSDAIQDVLRYNTEPPAKGDTPDAPAGLTERLDRIETAQHAVLQRVADLENRLVAPAKTPDRGA